MTIALPDFIAELTQNPALFITVLLTLGVILVNGWTDAPNAIATCVSTRSIGGSSRDHYGGGFQLPWSFGDDWPSTSPWPKFFII